MFDFIESIPPINEKFDGFYHEDEKKVMRNQMEDLGYETHNPFLNMKLLSLM